MQPFSEFIWGLKYQLKDKDGKPVDADIPASKARVAKALASVEKDKKKWEKEFREVLEYCVPAGRIMSNAGAEAYKSAVSLINCLAGDTPVLTKNGMRSIRSLADLGKEVEVLNGNGNWVKVLFKSYGVQTVYPLQFKYADCHNPITIKATANHRWILKSGKVITSEYWMTGDTNSRHTSISNVFVPENDTKYIKDEYNSGLIHGLVYGDGTKRPSEGDNVYQLDLLEEKSELAKYVTSILGFSPSDCVYNKEGSKGLRYRSIVSSIDYKELPKNPTSSYLKGFFAGILATDGSVTGNNETRGSTYISVYGSKRLTKFLEKYLPVIGVMSLRTAKKYSKGEYSNLGKRNNDVWSIDLHPATVKPSLILRQKHKEAYRLTDNGIHRSALWTFVGYENEPEEEEVFCCQEPETQSFVIHQGLLTGNCTVSDTIQDSMESIFEKLSEAALTLKAGCGIGYEFSSLRPKGAFVHGAGAATSGPLSFMDVYDKMCLTIMSAGGRRGAQMATFDISHPDVIDFIKAKREDGRLRQFNLSVLITDDFIEAVKKDELWELKWNGEVYNTVKARELWDIIMQSTYDYAEPGFLLIDKINKMNNLWFTEIIRATNPCVTGDTVILTSEGYKRIDSLVNQEVEIWNGFEWSYVTPKVTGENQEIIDFEFSDGTKLPCTPYHKFVLADGSRVEAKDLQIGSKLAKFKFPVIEGNTSIKTEVAYTQGFYSGDGQADTNRIWLFDEKCDLIPHMALSAYSDQSNSSENYRIMATMNKQPMPKDFVPSTKYTIKTRLDWLAGLMDSDGTVSSDGVVQIWSVDRDFLMNVKYMLNTLGANGTITIGKKAGKNLLPDGKGDKKEYDCQECWRIVISANHMVTLRELGLTTHRLDISYTPQRDASRFIQVTFMRKRKKLESKVYCFTEDKNHTGIFNGIMTAQCGEQPLPTYGSCLLGSIMLHMFVVNPFTDKAYFDFDKYKKCIRVFTRMLDNVVEMSGLPLAEQRWEIESKRRHGMGYLGLGSALAMLQVRYGSAEAVKFTEEVTRELAMTGFETGVELAKEKGMAPILTQKYKREDIKAYASQNKNVNWNGEKKEYTGKDLLVMSHYFDAWREDNRGAKILKDMAKHGCRFSHHSSIAPTGTISASFGENCSNGIEPSFDHSYIRNVIVAGNASKQDIETHSYEFHEYKKINPSATPDNLPDYFVVTDDLTPREHVDMQAAAQKWIDSSISKTINVPTDIDFDTFKDVYLYGYEKGLKGCTTFRYNPEVFTGVLVKKDDLKKTKYRFNLKDGSHIEVTGDQYVMYEGQQHLASNLADALKNGYYKKL